MLPGKFNFWTSRKVTEKFSKHQPGLPVDLIFFLSALNFFGYEQEKRNVYSSASQSIQGWFDLYIWAHMDWVKDWRKI